MITKVLVQPGEQFLVYFLAEMSVYLQQSAGAYLPRQSMWLEVAADIKTIFKALDRKTAKGLLYSDIQKYAISAPRFSSWFELNLSEGFSVFEFPLEHRRTIRTTNSLERINKEIRRRME